jgi:hypothetical protein
MANFFSQLDAAMASPDGAVALYEQAGGTPPDPAPVVTEHENETETEKEARLAVDQANLSKFGAVLQLHCGLMHYAALFVLKPDQKGLQDEWVAWLQKAAQIYPLLAMPQNTEDQNPTPPPSDSKGKKNREARNKARTPSFNPGDLKKKSMSDSIISKFLGFNAWGDKEQGTWAVQDLPKLFRTNVLEPLRTAPTPATLAAWDAYIAMANADETDNTKWNQVVYPPLQFDRASDDYAIQPSTDKLEVLVNLIKANPTFPQADDWITRVHQLLADYRAKHGGPPVTTQAPATNSTTPVGNPNVTITTEQQGDATIIITHTNSAPNPSSPPSH